MHFHNWIVAKIINKFHTRIKIVQFLRANKNRWFSTREIAKALNRKGNIAATVERAVAVTPSLYFNECTVVRRRVRFFYGCFDSYEIASNTVPEIDEIKSQTIT